MSNVLAVIGGSGLYSVSDMTEIEELSVDTPYGAPSDAIIRGHKSAGLPPGTVL